MPLAGFKWSRDLHHVRQYRFASPPSRLVGTLPEAEGPVDLLEDLMRLASPDVLNWRAMLAETVWESEIGIVSQNRCTRLP